MNHRTQRTLAGLASLLLLAAPSAQAQPAVTGFTGGSLFARYWTGTTGDVVGFSFTALEDFSVSHLGVFASDGNLDGSHEVGLWSTLDQVLLGSVIVTPASALTDGWRYEMLASNLSLTTGTSYTLGAVYAYVDGYYSNPSSVTLDPRIGNTAGVFPTNASLGFTFPAGTSANLARFGPNMIMAPATVVPEPSTYLLMATGLVAVGLVRARRNAKRA